MAWVVDTCIVLDVYLDDPEHGLRSAERLEQHRGEGLVICPVTFVELAPVFAGDLGEQKFFLSQADIDFSETWSSSDTETAHLAWERYVELKRRRRSGKRPVADILIGAFAIRFQGLITRNPNDFKPYFSHLTIVEP